MSVTTASSSLPYTSVLDQYTPPLASRTGVGRRALRGDAALPVFPDRRVRIAVVALQPPFATFDRGFASKGRETAYVNPPLHEGWSPRDVPLAAQTSCQDGRLTAHLSTRSTFLLYPFQPDGRDEAASLRKRRSTCFLREHISAHKRHSGARRVVLSMLPGSRCDA